MKIYIVHGLLISCFALLGFAPSGVHAGGVEIADLQGSWKLVEIASKPFQALPHADVPGFTIEDWSIEGFDGCNTFWGRLDKPDNLSSTRMGCPENALKLPLDLSNPMAHLEAGRIECNRLILPGRGNMPPSVFEREGKEQIR
jgi:heat shock protein HslJ